MNADLREAAEPLMPPPDGSAASSRSRTVAVACESTACLPDDAVRRYGIAVVPIPFVFGQETFLDGVDITTQEFYARLARADSPPLTSPPAPGEYVRAWQQSLAAAGSEARALVMVTASSRLTTFQRSTQLAQELAGELLPGVAVVVLDSGSAAMGQGFVTLAAARSAARGQSIEEVLRAAEAVKRRVCMIVTLDTLEYLARASRIPQVAAFVGSVLAIKPIVLFADGDVRQLARVRTRRRSINQVIEQLRLRAPAGGRLHMVVHHTQAADEAELLRRRLATDFDCAELTTREFSPVMGGYCGPGLLGVAFYAEATGDDESG
ncbi:MAG TPA: DegV family protein [Ktedonobacterales bacterium]